MSLAKKFTGNCILSGIRSFINNGLPGALSSRSNLHVLSQHAPSIQLTQAGTGYGLTNHITPSSEVRMSVQRLLTPFKALLTQVAGFKVKGRLRRRCKDCYFVVRQQRLYVICPTYPRHKQMAMKKREYNTWILTHATQSKYAPRVDIVKEINCKPSENMKIAVEGCAHGELEKIYETLEGIQKHENIKIDLLICCGDFQSTRNLEDLQTMAVPKKYLDICTFYKYYSGERIAPILTIFIGGNHEASNYLQELPYGGWVAPNIYYLGYAGVVRINGVRIAGISGIYKGHDFLRGRHEFPPYTEQTCRSVYHVRQLEVFRLKQLSGQLDVCLSHDWPTGICDYGNKAQLLRFKPHFREDLENNRLGSRPCEDLLKILKPKFWFSAHLHCKFSALVAHDISKEDEIDDKEPQFTKFLALDKCLPKRRFLQILEVNTTNIEEHEPILEYDLEWLTILSLTNHLINVKNSNYYLPNEKSNERYNFTPTEEEMHNVRKKLQDDLRIPKNFCRTVDPYQREQDTNLSTPQPQAQINPQCTQFCDVLGIDDPLSLAMIISGHELNHSSVLDDSTNMSDISSIFNTTDQTLLSPSSKEETELLPTPCKRRSNLGLSLPKPCSINEDAAIDILNTNNPDEINIIEYVENNANTFVEDIQPLSEEAKPQQKKMFKRRNQELYKKDDNEDIDS